MMVVGLVVMVVGGCGLGCRLGWSLGLWLWSVWLGVALRGLCSCVYGNA